MTGNYHDRWGPGAPNQADHIALGRAVLDGVRDAGNRRVFRELLDEGLQPWPVRRIIVTDSPEATHGIDTTEFLDQGVASLAAHAEYLRGLGEEAMTDPREFLEATGKAAGLRLGVRFARAAEVIVL